MGERSYPGRPGLPLPHMLGFRAQGHLRACLLPPSLLSGFESRSVGERKKTYGTRVKSAAHVVLIGKSTATFKGGTALNYCQRNHALNN